MRYGKGRFRFYAILLAAVAVLACEAEGTGGDGEPFTLAHGGAAAGGSGGDGGDGGDGGSGGAAAGGSGWSGIGGGWSGIGGGWGGSGGASGGSMDFDDFCAGEKVDPEPVEIKVETRVPFEVLVPEPIAVYIMLDKSGSMNDEMPTKWDVAVKAINTFVNDPNSEFIDVALQYFPFPFGENCDGTLFAVPAVPMGPLPENAENISNSLANTSPGGYTPVEGALRGLTQFCIQYQARVSDKRCVGVLISDGRPTMCTENSGVLIDIAAYSYDEHDVRTFTVGMQGDTDFDLLDQIALFGGTDCTSNPDGTADPADGHYCDVRPGSGMTLLQAFEAIREFVTDLEWRTEYQTKISTKISACDWGIPNPPEGKTFDKNMVNVVFSSPEGDDLTIPYLKSDNDCEEVSYAWYYDDEDNPTKLIACPRTCDFITSVEGAMIDIQFGCETKLAAVE